MSNKKLLILGITAAVMVVLSVLQSRMANKNPSIVSAGSSLIQGLDIGAVGSIEIISEGKQLNLNRNGNMFVVAQRDNYPAQATRINDLITSCLDLTTIELITSSKSNHADLGVDSEGAKWIVKFLDAQGNQLTGVVISQSDPESNSSYARLFDSDKVYKIENSPWIRTSPTDYIDRELINTDKDNIETVEVAIANESYTLKTEGEDNKIVLDNMPEGKQFKENEYEKVFTALTSFRFDDVISKASGIDVVFDTKYVCKLKDSTVYKINLAKKDDKFLAMCTAEFTDTEKVEKERRVESEEELKAKEEKLLARDNAQAFAAKHAGWIYEIPKYKADNLAKKVSDILEDIPQEQPEEETAQDNQPSDDQQAEPVTETQPPAEQ